MNKQRIILSAVIIAAFLFLAVYSIQSCKNSPEENPVTKLEFEGDFAGDKVCGSCHLQEYNDWKTSDHYHAMLPASDSSVLGNFNNQQYSADGITSRFFRKGEKYFVNTQGNDGGYHDYEVKYTFGIRPLQQYLVEFPGGRMQTLRQCWDVNEKKWFHQYPHENLHHHDWLHWSRSAQNWNAMCASCHSTNLQTNYNASSDTFNTTWSIINVSCEACHGSGRKHIEYVSSADYSKKEKIPGSYLLIHKGQTSEEQIASCAPCHSRRLVVDESPFQTLQLMDYYIPEVPHNVMYHADGQINDEDYEYGSFTQSRMFMHNVKCSDCHNSHSGNLIMTGNALCLQCHKKELDLPTHTFHAANSEGSQCINCHMPSKYYMVNDLRHDHSMRVPRPDQSVKYGTPNACNNCHDDKSAKWAADQIVQWFGPDREYHYSDDLIPGSLGDTSSSRHLRKLALPDTNVPAIIHATALHYMAYSYDPRNITTLINGLKDPVAIIRYQALRSLRFYPAEQWLNDAISLLNDPVKSVRIAAADLFLEHEDSISSFKSSFASAKKEFDKFILLNAAEPTGRMMMADVASRSRNYEKAEMEYLIALKMDSLLIPARINLATMYDIIGKTQEALQHLKIASKIDPNNEQVNYYLALIHVELKDNETALRYFKKAAAVSRNPRIFYNYGLLLQQLKRDSDAEKIYLRGLAINPNDGDLNYVLTLFYYNRKDSEKALPYALKLMELMPQNEGYQQLYQAIQPH